MLNGVQTATLTKNTWALCATRHTVRAEATGAEAGKDNILVSYKLESTSGIGKGYHTKDGYLHKIRITIFKDGEIAYQQDVAGDDSGNFITLPPFLITGEGKWEITAKTIAAGDCAKPEGEKNFAYLYAKSPEPVEEEQEEDRAKTAQDLTPLLTVGMVGLAGLVFGKVLRGKRKAAENLQNEWPVCKCGDSLTGNPRYAEQKCLSCGKLSHQMCGDKRKQYTNCAFCKSTNVEMTNEKEFYKWRDFERKAKEKIWDRKLIKKYCSKDVLSQKSDKELLFALIDMSLPIKEQESRYQTIERILEKCNSLKENHPNLKAAETFEAPKKQPTYITVMEVLKQGLYEPNSEQYKLMKEIWKPNVSLRLTDFWEAYAYLEWMGASEEGYSHPEYGKNFTPIPANIKSEDKRNVFRWIYRQQKKTMPRWIIKRDSFINSIKRAREIYGINYEQEGFPAIYSNWIRYDGKLFYYKGVYDRNKGIYDQSITSNTSFHSILDDVGKEALNNLDNQQKRGLLKGDKDIYWGLKKAETFEAKETPKYQQAMDFIHRIFYEPNSEEYKVFQQVKRVTQAPHSLWYIWDTYCYFNLRQTEQYQDLLKGGKNRLRANLGKCGRFREERELYSKYGVMNLQQFINAIAAAERKAQINIRVIGDGSRFFVHNNFVYITTGYDANVLWDKSSIFPDYSRQGKEKFGRLLSFQKKIILMAKAGKKEAIQQAGSGKF